MNCSLQYLAKETFEMQIDRTIGKTSFNIYCLLKNLKEVIFSLSRTVPVPPPVWIYIFGEINYDRIISFSTEEKNYTLRHSCIRCKTQCYEKLGVFI